MWGCSTAKYSVWYVEMLSDCDSSVHKDSSVSSSHVGKMWKCVSLNVYTMLVVDGDSPQKTSA